MTRKETPVVAAAAPPPTLGARSTLGPVVRGGGAPLMGPFQPVLINGGHIALGV